MQDILVLDNIEAMLLLFPNEQNRLGCIPSVSFGDTEAELTSDSSASHPILQQAKSMGEDNYLSR
jgi:hypothetical protein